MENEEKKEVVSTKKEPVKKVDLKDEKGETTPQIRQIIIETDGDDIKITKAEVAGRIELLGIFQALITHITSQKK